VPLEGWDAGDVVIAADNSDPFILRLAEGGNEDAPVYTSAHGMGDWDWQRVANSFEEFLDALGR
jgi:hypothetical protein